MVADKEDEFFEFEKNRITVIYGAGYITRTYYTYFSELEYICDERADDIRFIGNIEVVKPEILLNEKRKCKVVVCIQNEAIRKEIICKLENMCSDAIIYDFFENRSFNLYHEKKYVRKKGCINKVNIVCQDGAWIFNKFAVKMKEELIKRNVEVSIDSVPHSDADINHFIAHHFYQPIIAYNDSLMITHVDSLNKVELIKHQLKTAKIGICMSKETMNWLTSVGVPREKLCYINPAQDGVIKPRKYVLGITGRNHESLDNRSRASALLDICEKIDPTFFSFLIMGDGWDRIVDKIKNIGFDVKYYNEFIYDEYVKIMPSLDYYLYWGFDEGSMGFLDAVAAGIGTIVTPQGYHLDVKDGITYPCRTIQDFIDILIDLENKKKKRVESVKEWNWGNYVEKHLEVWNYILGFDDNLFQKQHRYEDGLYSILKIEA